MAERVGLRTAHLVLWTVHVEVQTRIKAQQ